MDLLSVSVLLSVLLYKRFQVTVGQALKSLQSLPILVPRGVRIVRSWSPYGTQLQKRWTPSTQKQMAESTLLGYATSMQASSYTPAACTTTHPQYPI